MANVIFGFSPKLQEALETRIARIRKRSSLGEPTLWKNITFVAPHSTAYNSYACLQALITNYKVYADPKEMRQEVFFNDAAELLGMVVSAEETHQAIACMMTYINNFCFPNISRLDPEAGETLTKRLGNLPEKSQEWKEWRALETEAFSADTQLSSSLSLPLQFGPRGMPEDSQHLAESYKMSQGRRHDIPPFNHPQRQEALGTIPIDFFEEAENAARFLLGLLK